MAGVVCVSVVVVVSVFGGDAFDLPASSTNTTFDGFVRLVFIERFLF